MKKTLLYLTSILLFSASSINAQIDVWDFAATPSAEIGAGYTGIFTDATLSAISVGTGSATTNYVGPFTAGRLTYTNASAATSKDRMRTNNTSTINVAAGITRYDENITGSPAITPVFSPAPTYYGRLYCAGAGSATNRLFTLTLAAGENVTLITRIESADGVLTYVVPAGATAIPSVNMTVAPAIVPPATETTGKIQEIHFQASIAGNYSFYATLGKLVIYRIYAANVSNIVLATKTFQKELDVTVFAKDSKIFLSNIKSSTKVEVYNVLGALVKSAQADADTSLDINSGVYIVKAQSSEGGKSVKVIVQ